MFGKENPNGPPAPPPMQFPDLRTYSVKNQAGQWEEVDAHHATIEHGCLCLHRGIFINEECTQLGAEPAGIYAPGEWKRCKTDYKGYAPPSSLAL